MRAIMSGMTTRQEELSQFLKSRRARLAPADVGLTAARNGRRVIGLRREELAMLAGVSPDYYARLEQGPSTSPTRCSMRSRWRCGWTNWSGAIWRLW